MGKVKFHELVPHTPTDRVSIPYGKGKVYPSLEHMDVFYGINSLWER